MLDYNIRIGLVPLRRDCTPRPGQFNWEIAEERVKREILTLCKKNLIKYSVPRVIEIVEEMPRTKFGKIDFKKLELENN